MKAFLVLLVLFAAGLAGVLYFRKVVQTPRAPVVAAAGEPVKEAKDRRRRRRHGARRLPHSTAPVTSPQAAPGEASTGQAPAYEEATAQGRSGAFAPPDERPTLPGGASVSEAAPDDVFGASAPSPGLAAAPSGKQPDLPDEPAPVKLRPGDTKIVWQGEDLSRAETMRLDFSNDGNGHELTDDEIDARFRTKEDAVLGCIARARPNESTFVPGHVTVRFRIQRTGIVKGVQVEAPVILHKGGLTGCIRNVVSSLKFPASNMGQVISFPFSLM